MLEVSFLEADTFSSQKCMLFSPVHAFLVLQIILSAFSGLSGCICTHTCIKITISSLYLQSEPVKILCLHGLVPEQLLNTYLCFEAAPIVSAILLSKSSLITSTICCEKAAAALTIFNKSPFYPVLLDCSAYCKHPSMYPRCPIPAQMKA